MKKFTLARLAYLALTGHDDPEAAFGSAVHYGNMLIIESEFGVSERAYSVLKETLTSYALALRTYLSGGEDKPVPAAREDEFALAMAAEGAAVLSYMMQHSSSMFKFAVGQEDAVSSALSTFLADHNSADGKPFGVIFVPSLFIYDNLPFSLGDMMDAGSPIEKMRQNANNRVPDEINREGAPYLSAARAIGRSDLPDLWDGVAGNPEPRGLAEEQLDLSQTFDSADVEDVPDGNIYDDIDFQ